MFKSKIKTCQNCKIKFTIEPEDFEFYKKIDVPEPTFCPECRAQRRFAFWNLLSLYKRKCDFSGKNIVSIFRPDSPYKVYESKIWWSDKWDPMEYGKEYDFKKPFFEQLKELKLTVPQAHNLNINSVNCDYCAGTFNSKNCYLSVCNGCEDCFYSMAGLSNSCFDSFFIIQSENCYENLFCFQNYNVYFSQYSNNCIDSAFLYDCRNCHNCFGCVNLKHKKYHIFNKPYSREQYFKKLKEFNLASYQNLLKVEKEFNRFKLKLPRKYARIHNSHDVSGDNIRDAKNCHDCFSLFRGSEDSRYIYGGGNNLKDSYDVFDTGSNAELIYESTSVGANAGRVFFSFLAAKSAYDIYYSDNCYSSSVLFGCVGLRHKKHCILNRQYTKESFDKLMTKIKKHMNDMPYTDKKGRVYKYGEFFPIELSAFDYNKSVAQEHFPLTKKQALEQGYKWYDRPESDYNPTMKFGKLPDNINNTDRSILKEIIECGNLNCTGSGVFRIISQEYKFLKKHNLPLPRFCSECRAWNRLKNRNLLKLWTRKCMKSGCSNEFQTTYSPNRKEIVYCEACYNEEIG